MADLIIEGIYIGGLGNHKNRFPHPPTGIWKVSMEALLGFAHIFRPDGLSSILQSHLENGSRCGNSGQKGHSKDRAGRGASHCQDPDLGLTGGHILSITSSDKSLLGNKYFRVMVPPFIFVYS